MQTANLRRRFVTLGAFALLLSAACGDTPDAATRALVAATCSINSDCASPLVCTFGSCHVQCATTPDCVNYGEGLCVQSDKPYRVCQNEDEQKCTLNSDCAGEQICGLDAQCRDACTADRDCATSQKCVSATCVDPEDLVGGALEEKIKPAAGTPCVRASDCPADLVCLFNVCTVECVTNKDCDYGVSCVDRHCQNPTGGAGAGGGGGGSGGASGAAGAGAGGAGQAGAGGTELGGAAGTSGDAGASGSDPGGAGGSEAAGAGGENGGVAGMAGAGGESAGAAGDAGAGGESAGAAGDAGAGGDAGTGGSGSGLPAPMLAKVPAIAGLTLVGNQVAWLALSNMQTKANVGELQAVSTSGGEVEVLETGLLDPTALTYSAFAQGFLWAESGNPYVIRLRSIKAAPGDGSIKDVGTASQRVNQIVTDGSGAYVGTADALTFLDVANPKAKRSVLTKIPTLGGFALDTVSSVVYVTAADSKLSLAVADRAASGDFFQGVKPLASVAGTKNTLVTAGQDLAFFVSEDKKQIIRADFAQTTPHADLKNACGALLLDNKDKVLYWADGGAIWAASQEAKATDAHIVYDGAGFVSALAVDAEAIYWADTKLQSINRQLKTQKLKARCRRLRPRLRRWTGPTRPPR
jgi:hypothetical protein